MNLRSSPTIAFTIPSVYDKTQLDCRIYIPRELKRLELASTWWKRGGIIAHPYAPLGGCYDDPVVSLVGGELLQAGYVVGTFNFRYVHTSTCEAVAVLQCGYILFHPNFLDRSN